MAKLRSFIKLEGTLEDLTFYKTQDGYMVRTKGGVSRNRIKHDPAFARTRENGVEFGNVATSGKYIRRSITSLLLDASDNRVSSRLTHVLSQVKNQDLTSVRGQRNVAMGLATPAGQAILRGFDFNKDAPMDSVLQTPYTLDTATGDITIPDLIPDQQLGIPEGATHVSFSGAFLNLDLDTNTKDLQLSPVDNLPISSTVGTISLSPTSPATGTGNSYYFLKIAFYQEVNGVQYSMNNGAFNSLYLIDVL